MEVYFQTTGPITGYDLHYTNVSNIYVEIEHSQGDTSHFLDRPIRERMTLSEFLCRLGLEGSDAHIKRIMIALSERKSNDNEIHNLTKYYGDLYVRRLRSGQILHPNEKTSLGSIPLTSYQSHNMRSMEVARYEYLKQKEMAESNGYYRSTSPLLVEDSYKSIDEEIYYLLTS